MTRGLRFGVCLPQFTTDPELTLRVALEAENAGYDAVSLFDHLTPLGGPPSRPILECLTTLTTVAARTERVTVLPLVLRAGLRPPATAAAAFRGLAELAPGRVIAAIGAGDRHNEGEDVAAGLPALTQPQRREQVRGLIGALRQWAPGVPVWLGGNGVAMRQLAAEGADGWNLWGASADHVRIGAAAVAVDAAAVGRPAPEVSWGGQVVLAPTAAEADRRLAAWSSEHPGADVAGVVTGDAEGVAAALARLADAGVSTFIVSFIGEGTAVARREFVTDVAPMLRARRPV